MSVADLSRIMSGTRINNYENVIFQRQREVLDSELNLVQKISTEKLKDIIHKVVKLDHGFLRKSVFSNPGLNYFAMGILSTDVNQVFVNGNLIDIRGTNNSTDYINEIVLSDAPLTGTRTDFVWLEVWVADILPNKSIADGISKPTRDTIYRYGNIDYGGTNLTDEQLDVSFGKETAVRAQIQYQIRSAEDAGDFSASSVKAKDGIHSFSQATDIVTGEALNGLYIAQNTLSTYGHFEVDEDNNPLPYGYHYAIPLCTVLRTAGETAIDLNGVSDFRQSIGVSTLDPDTDYTINGLIVQNNSGPATIYINSPAGQNSRIIFKRGGVIVGIMEAFDLNKIGITDASEDKIITFDTDKKIGIGTTSPTEHIHIYEESGSTKTPLFIESDNTEISLDIENKQSATPAVVLRNTSGSTTSDYFEIKEGTQTNYSIDSDGTINTRAGKLTTLSNHLAVFPDGLNELQLGYGGGGDIVLYNRTNKEIGRWDDNYSNSPYFSVNVPSGVLQMGENNTSVFFGGGYANTGTALNPTPGLTINPDGGLFTNGMIQSISTTGIVSSRSKTVASDGYLYLGYDGSSFYSHYLKWNNTLSQFEFSNTLFVSGTNPMNLFELQVTNISNQTNVAGGQIYTDGAWTFGINSAGGFPASFVGKKLIIKSHASDSNTHIFEVQNPSGAGVAWIDEAGDMTIHDLYVTGTETVGSVSTITTTTVVTDTLTANHSSFLGSAFGDISTIIGKLQVKSSPVLSVPDAKLNLLVDDTQGTVSINTNTAFASGANKMFLTVNGGIGSLYTVGDTPQDNGVPKLWVGSDFGNSAPLHGGLSWDKNNNWLVIDNTISTSATGIIQVHASTVTVNANKIDNFTDTDGVKVDIEGNLALANSEVPANDLMLRFRNFNNLGGVNSNETRIRYESGPKNRLFFSKLSSGGTESAPNVTFDMFNSRVGIGTNEPLYRLQVDTTGTGDTSALFIRNTSTADGDSVSILAQTHESVGFQDRGKISFKRTSATGSSTDFYYGNSGLQFGMRLNHDGHLGIGTNIPDFRLSVSSASTVQAIFGQDVSGGVGIVIGNENATDKGFIITTNQTAGTATSVDMGIIGDNALTIMNGGNVGINTVNPLSTFHINSASVIPFRITNAFTPDSDRADIAYLVNTTSDNTLRIGSIGTNGGVTLQVTKISPSGTKSNLVLNPDGGNIGIGITNPTAQFEVGTGSASLTYLVKIGGRVGQEGSAGLYVVPDLSMAGSAKSNIYGVVIQPNINDFLTGIESTNYMGLYIPVPSSNGTVTNAYGLYVNSPIQGVATNTAAYFGGNVGIGSTIPLQKVVIESTGDVRQIIKSITASTGVARLFLTPSNNDALTCSLTANSDGTFSINTYGKSELTLSGGKVGIGCAIPEYQLEMMSPSSVSQSFIKVKDSDGNNQMAVYSDASGNAIQVLCDTSGNNQIVLNTAGVSYFTGGNFGIGTNNPQTLLHAYALIGHSALRVETGSVATYAAYASFKTGVREYTLGSDASNSNFFIYDSTGSVTRMIIDSAGKVGIGTQPVARMHVVGDTTDTLFLQRTTTTNSYCSLQFKNAYTSGASDAGIYHKAEATLANSFLGFSGNNSNFHMVVLNGGNVGIGSTIPIALLDVAGTGRFTGVVTSTVITNTAPFTITSTTKVANLNVDAVDGYHISGTTAYLPKYTSATTIGDSIIRDDGTNIGIGIAPSQKLHVNGIALFSNGGIDGTLSDVVHIAGVGYPTSYLHKIISTTGSVSNLQFHISTGASTLREVLTLNSNGTVTIPVAIGTAPLSITSTTKVANLHVDMVDNYNINAGTNNTLLKYIDGSTIGNSLLSDNGSIVTVGGTLAMGINSITTSTTNNSSIGSGTLRFATGYFTSVNTTGLTVGATGASFGGTLAMGTNSITGTGTIGCGTISATTLTGTLSTAAQPNVTSAAALVSFGVLGTAGKISKFASTQTFTDSLLSESGTIITVGGTLAMGANSITTTGTGHIGATGSRWAKGWFTEIQSGNLNFAANIISSNTAGGIAISPLTANSLDVNLAGGGNFNISLAGGGDLILNTNLLYVDSGAGNIGLSTATPALKLAIYGTQGSPATSGTSQTGVLRIANPTTANVLDFGNYGSPSYGSWMQATSSTDLSLEYSLVLQPNGGYVGIGGAPTQLLHLVASSPAYQIIQSTASNSISGLYLQNDSNNYSIKLRGDQKDILNIYDETNSASRITVNPNSSVDIHSDLNLIQEKVINGTFDDALYPPISPPTGWIGVGGTVTDTGTFVQSGGTMIVTVTVGTDIAARPLTPIPVTVGKKYKFTCTSSGSFIVRLGSTNNYASNEYYSDAVATSHSKVFIANSSAVYIWLLARSTPTNTATFDNVSLVEYKDLKCNNIQANQPFCSVKDTTNQTLPDNSAIYLTWNTILSDTLSMYQTGKFTTLQGGLYLCILTCYLNITVATQILVVFQRYNSSNALQEEFMQQVYTNNGGNYVRVNNQGMCRFADGDYLKLKVWNASSGCVVMSGTSPAPNWNAYFQMTKLS